MKPYQLPITGDTLQLSVEDVRIGPVELKLVDQFDSVVVRPIKGAQFADEGVHLGGVFVAIGRPQRPQPAGQHVLVGEEPVVLELEAAHEDVQRVDVVQLPPVTVPAVVRTRFRLQTRRYHRRMIRRV